MIAILAFYNIQCLSLLISHLRRDLAHADQALDTDHPVATLISLLSLDIHLHATGDIEVLRLKSLSKLIETLNSIRLNKFLIVQMIKENIETFLGILNLSCERGWGLGSDPLHVTCEYIDKLLSV